MEPSTIGPSGERPKAEARRVAVVQAQARRTLTLSAVFALAAGASGLVPHQTGWWLPLHLFLVGSLLLAISGVTQLFAVTWAAGPPPRGSLAAVQRWLLAVGALGVALCREINSAVGVMLFAAAVVISLVLLGTTLAWIVTRAVQRRFDVSLHFYVTALGAGAIGSVIGVVLATGTMGASKVTIVRWRPAHLSLNLFGLVGLVIAGTLPFFSATEARVKMSPRATPRALDGLLLWLAASLVACVPGFVYGSLALASGGLAAYTLGLLALLTALPSIGPKQLRWAGPLRRRAVDCLVRGVLLALR